MAYLALYRKYRSQAFGEVIGQEHVTTVLQNALRLGRVAHAYLFCGPRGCGKTSTARLLARALNCLASDKPAPAPCGECSMCRRIRDGSAIDVVEMDAASETGIDDVREKIIENAKYSPAEARFKVYIIDEVHDLSLKAFDSLLKTIEEPPAHVVFILATTEAHKVPLTVRSRCQRMDFRRGTIADLAGNIVRVLEQEGLPFEADAVAAVARAAEGSFRDSLSILEQVLAFTDGALTAVAVHESIGSVGPDVLDEVTRVIAADDLAEAFRMAGRLVDSGRDVKQTLIGLQAHMRDLLVAGFCRDASAMSDVSAERFAALKEMSRSFTEHQVLRMLDVLADAERDTRFTNHHRLLLERALWSVLPSRLAAAVPAAPAAGVPAHPPVRPSPAPAPAVQRPPTPSRAVSPPQTSSHQGAPVSPPQTATSTAAPAQAPGVSAASSTPTRFAAEIDLEGMRRIWPRVRARLIKSSKNAAGVFVNEQVLALDGNTLVLGFSADFYRGKADRPLARKAVEEALAAELHMTGIRIRCVLTSEWGAPGEPAASAVSPGSLLQEPVDAPTEPAPQANPSPPASPAGSDLLNSVIETFDGTVVDD